MEESSRSVYRRGADDGFKFGIYLSVLYIASACGITYPLLNSIATVMFLATPFILYRFLRRSYRDNRGQSSFSELWMQGILTFICGCLIMAVPVYAYLRFINTGFILGQLQQTIELSNTIATPAALDLARKAQFLIDNNAIPTPALATLMVFFSGSFTGSILSGIVAVLVKALNRTVPSDGVK